MKTTGKKVVPTLHAVQKEKVTLKTRSVPDGMGLPRGLSPVRNPGQRSLCHLRMDLGAAVPQDVTGVRHSGMDWHIA